MTEIELKILNIDRAKIVAKLAALGARRVMRPTRLHEVYFESRSFVEKGKRTLRLRREGKEVLLTAKVKRDGGRFDVRTETEIAVSDFKRTRTLLETAGFRAVREREKVREEYRVRGMKVEIDRYPRMKRPYVEIEGKNRRAIERLVADLGFSMRDTTNKTATKILRELGLPARKLVF